MHWLVGNLCCGMLRVIQAIMGLQPLYFRDSELARRARIPAEAGAGEKTGTLAVASG